MMEAARTSETSVDIQLRTRQYIPEDSELHTRRRENLKSHRLMLFREIIAVSTENHTPNAQLQTVKTLYPLGFKCLADQAGNLTGLGTGFYLASHEQQGSPLL
jgi:hypothetical protein